MGSATTPAVLLARRPERRFSAADLALGELPLGAPAAGQVLVRNTWMSLDPSTRGRMDPTEKQYTENFAVGEPLDGWALGVVERSRAPQLPVGAVVRHRSGWRERAVIGASACRVVDLDLAPAPAWLGTLGQTGFTAWVGLTAVGGLQPGETVVVSAAGGGVGSVAGQLARLLGAGRVVGTAGGPAKCDRLVTDLGYHAAVDHRAGDVGAALAGLAPGGVDLFFDNVGGAQLAAVLNQLRVGGRVALCGMMTAVDGVDGAGGAPQPPLSRLLEVILRRVTIRGFIVRDHEALRPAFERQVAGWLRAGELVDRSTVFDGLALAPKALEALLAGQTFGKGLVRIGA